MLYLGVEKLGISNKIMPIINIILTTPINFLLNKYFVFKKEE
jgi:GtrA-like protein.